MDFATQKRYFNRCDPFEALKPEDNRNLDLDNFSRGQARGASWVERLAGRIERSDKPVFELFTGLPGSGKSTELQRLAKRLERPDRAHLLPVLADADQLIDQANEIDVPEILSALLLRVEATVLEKEGKDPGQALEDGFFTRLWTWLRNTDLELGKGEFTIPSGPKLVFELRTRPSLRQKVRSVVTAHLTYFLGEVRKELKLLEGRAIGCGYTGLVVVFDSLEKMRGTSANWRQVLDSVEQLFAAGAPHLRLPVHVLYTIPAALVTRRVEAVHFIPMIKLQDRAGVSFTPGYEAARELVRCRIPDDVLGELLGEKCEERIRELIAWSGGYPREIVRLLQNAFTLPQVPLPDGDFQGLWNELLDAYRRAVPSEAFPWLARVARERYLTLEDDRHRESADLMLSNNALLRYLNDRDWFDLHPAVREIPGVAAAIAAVPPVIGPENG
jgi:hypothetical protein